MEEWRNRVIWLVMEADSEHWDSRTPCIAFYKEEDADAFIKAAEKDPNEITTIYWDDIPVPRYEIEWLSIR